MSGDGLRTVMWLSNKRTRDLSCIPALESWPNKQKKHLWFTSSSETVFRGGFFVLGGREDGGGDIVSCLKAFFPL